jgi:hypothetical protein
VSGEVWGSSLCVPATAPDLDRWLPDPSIRVVHHRQSTVSTDRLWLAARQTQLRDTRLLGHLIRWRLPGVAVDSSFEEFFRNPPFTVLDEADRWLVSGVVGRIWTLRRDYPILEDSAEFRRWSSSGTAKVVFGHCVQATEDGRSALRSEVRAEAFGAQGQLGLASVRPLIRAFEHLVGSDALAAAVRRAERG